MLISGVPLSMAAAKAAIAWLIIDIETYSSVDLAKCGVYRYVLSPDFQVTIFGYSINGGPAIVVDLLQGQQIPCDVLEALTNSSVVKWAHNANFERICLSRYLSNLGIPLDPGNPNARFLNPASWRCSMVWAASLGLPQSLEAVGKALNLENQKLEEGKNLIRFFCLPCVPTKVNGGRTRNMPADAPDDWSKMLEYNARDVEVELQLLKRFSKQPLPESAWQNYALSEVINDRGVGVDMPFVRSCIALSARSSEKLTEAMRELTGLENPNSGPQLKEWLARHGCPMDTLGKKDVEARLLTAPEEAARVLRLRLQASKTSVKKYDAMADAICPDGRIRGMFRFFGASRTGRFTGHLVQLQNLPKNHIPDLVQARALAAGGDYEALEMLYDDVADTLSQLIRTALIPQNVKKLIVADYNAIEARVVSWLAGEQWKMDAFARGEDIYCATASQMFHLPVVKHGINGELRAKGKVAELACSYGGSKGALKAMGALEMGLKEDELDAIVKSWRAANSKIVALWYAVDRAAQLAVFNGTQAHVGQLKFSCENNILFITLPSGRRLAYARPHMGTNKFGGACITYEGTGQMNKWERQETYGAKLVENIVQGTSLDILLYAMGTLRNYGIVAHVHDEVIIEADQDVSCDKICELMSQTPPWASGLGLRAEGYECEFYRKD